MTYLYGIILAALLLLGAAAYGHHVGYASGEEAGAKLASTAQDKQHDAELSAGMCVSALDATTAATDAAKARADLMQSQAQTIIDGVTKGKSANLAAGAAFGAKVDSSSRTGDCRSVLEAQLCPALYGY